MLGLRQKKFAMEFLRSQKLKSKALKREVIFDLGIPTLKVDKNLPLLLINDGQDFEALKLQELLSDFKKAPFYFVGIHCNENRLHEYGVIDLPDYLNRGDLASAYANFILKELLPHLKKKFDLKYEKITSSGCSLGGLSAFDLAVSYPKIFNKCGVFSGSFWWRDRALNDGYSDDVNRIMHQKIKNLKLDKNQSFWFQCGTKDEEADRNKNGIIDAIDDTLDLIKILKANGLKVHYQETKGGMHNCETWSKEYPKFLEWAFS